MASVSVVIPTHNRMDTLLVALEHLQAGSVVPDEVIVVDDGSDVAVEPLLQAREFAYRLRVLRFEPGRGAPAARNAGMRAASGDVLVMIDDDIFLDHHAIRYHKRIHEERPEDTYGVMGRVNFDPDLTRTPLMHFLEEYDCFQGIAKAPDKSRVISGLISANFSLKRSFLDGKELFDEAFPFNRNEDTEFGLRMMEHDLDLRFHIAPSARHHSPLALDTHFRQVWKGGFSKAYWAIQRPDHSKNCLNLGTALNRKRHERSFMESFENYVECFGQDFLDADIRDCSPTAFEAFGFFVKTATGWFQAIGTADGWMEMVPGLAGASENILRGIDSEQHPKRLDFFRSAYSELDDFLPMALLLADELSALKRYEEAFDALRPHAASVWSKLRLAELTLHLGRFDACETYLREIWEATRHGRAVDYEQRSLMSKTFARLEKKHTPDPAWIEAMNIELSDEDVSRSKPWADALSQANSNARGAGSTVTDMEKLAQCEESLKDVGRSAHYVPGQHGRAKRIYDFLTDGRRGAASKLFRDIGELAQSVASRRRSAEPGPQYR